MDQEAFQKLKQQMIRVLAGKFRTVREVTVNLEDYVSHAIQKTLEKGYRPGQEDFLPYAVRCAVNAAYDDLRRLRHRAAHAALAAHDPPPDHEDAIIHTTMIREAMKTLSQKCYQLLYHIYYMGYEIAELVGPFGANAHAVSQQKVRCLGKLLKVCAAQ